MLLSLKLKKTYACFLCTVIASIVLVGHPAYAQLRHQFESDRAKRAVGDQGMVSSAHPLASEAGLEMLKKGGNAVDAAVATAFALGVVEPHMSGIGGGGAMLIWNQKREMAHYVDFYSAKRAATYRDEDHGTLDSSNLQLRSVGIPGTVAGLLEALERHGTFTRELVMAPAIRYAREGFPVYLTFAQFIIENKDKLHRYQGAKDLFWPAGKPMEVGELFVQPKLAAILERISMEGSKAFYSGEIADRIVTVLNDGQNPISLLDLEEYAPQWQKTPLMGTFGEYTVLSAPMPQSGLSIVQGLNILENFDLKRAGLPTTSPEAFDIFTSTMRATIADRVKYVDDPNWNEIPVSTLVGKPYAVSRSALVGTGSAVDRMEPGNPTELAIGEEKDIVAMAETSGGETTHLSVVDAHGNAVSLSTTLSPVFGEGAWVDGFLLNSSGYDFAEMRQADQWQARHPYRIRASTISPTIILKDNKVKLVIGAPGGSRIPTTILQSLVYILVYGLDPLDAVRMPRIFPSWSTVDVEIEGGFDPSLLHAARKLGYNVKRPSDGYARIYLVYKEGGQLIGVSDPRHDGEPRGF